MWTSFMVVLIMLMYNELYFFWKADQKIESNLMLLKGGKMSWLMTESCLADHYCTESGSKRHHQHAHGEKLDIVALPSDHFSTRWQCLYLKYFRAVMYRERIWSHVHHYCLGQWFLLPKYKWNLACCILKANSWPLYQQVNSLIQMLCKAYWFQN